GEGASGQHGVGAARAAPAAEEAGAIGFELQRAHRDAVGDGEVGEPDLGIELAAAAACGEQHLGSGDEFGLHEKIGEGRVGGVGGGGREHHFGVGGDLDDAGDEAVVGDGDAAQLDVVFGPDLGRLEVAEIDEAAPGIAGRVLAPAGEVEAAPAAAARAGGGEQQRIGA